MLSTYTENWLNDYIAKRYPNQLAPLRHAYEIAAAARQSKQLPPQEAEQLYQYACDKRSILANNAGDLLGKLAKTLPAARAQLERMAADSRAVVRLQAVLSLAHLPLDDGIAALLCAALRDRSSQVRSAAAMQIVRREAKNLAEPLVQAVRQEKNADNQRFMQEQLDCLLQGYSIAYETDGSITICFGGDMYKTYADQAEFDNCFAEDLADFQD